MTKTAKTAKTMTKRQKATTSMTQKTTSTTTSKVAAEEGLLDARLMELNPARWPTRARAR
jgi:hypothetical protein